MPDVLWYFPNQTNQIFSVSLVSKDGVRIIFENEVAKKILHSYKSILKFLSSYINPIV